jgi:hypothetical protein
MELLRFLSEGIYHCAAAKFICGPTIEEALPSKKRSLRICGNQPVEQPISCAVFQEWVDACLWRKNHVADSCQSPFRTSPFGNTKRLNPAAQRLNHVLPKSESDNTLVHIRKRIVTLCDFLNGFWQPSNSQWKRLMTAEPVSSLDCINW